MTTKSNTDSAQDAQTFQKGDLVTIDGFDAELLNHVRDGIWQVEMEGEYSNHRTTAHEKDMVLVNRPTQP